MEPAGIGVGVRNGITYLLGDEAPIKVGEQIRKRFSAPDDGHQDGEVAVVISGIKAPPAAAAQIRSTLQPQHASLFGGCMYVVDFGDGIPVHIADYRVELVT